MLAVWQNRSVVLEFLLVLLSAESHFKNILSIKTHSQVKKGAVMNKTNLTFKRLFNAGQKYSG